jgi:hypothetical protein
MKDHDMFMNELFRIVNGAFRLGINCRITRHAAIDPERHPSPEYLLMVQEPTKLPNSAQWTREITDHEFWRLNLKLQFVGENDFRKASQLVNWYSMLSIPDNSIATWPFPFRSPLGASATRSGISHVSFGSSRASILGSSDPCQLG